MRIDSNNKKANIFYIFLLIQPILDLFTSLMVRFTNLPLTIGMIVRGLFLFTMVIYLLFVNKSVHKKKSIIYLGILCIFSIIYLITKNGIFNLGFLKTEITYLFKYMYFPIVALCLINAFDELQLKKEKIFKVCIVEAIIYSILIILPEITNTAFSSYVGNNKGTVGWFYAANEIGAIMVALFPFLYYLLFEREGVVKIALTFTIVILAMTLLGTKTSFLGMLITEVIYALYFLFTNPTPKSLSSILALSYISKVLKKNLSLPLNATFIILCALGLLTVYLLLFLILSVSSLISSSM